MSFKGSGSTETVTAATKLWIENMIDSSVNIALKYYVSFINNVNQLNSDRTLQKVSLKMN